MGRVATWNHCDTELGRYCQSGTGRKGLEGEVQWEQKQIDAQTNHHINAQPRLHQRAPEIQPYGTVNHALPLELEEPVRLEMAEQLHQLLADSITLRDLYKKSHWQVAGATFYQLHLLFDKHHDEQAELVDSIAERIQLLGGVSLAMAADVAETTQIERPPRGREEVPVQLSRLIDAHQVIIRQARTLCGVHLNWVVTAPTTRRTNSDWRNGW
jgi:starvation-inducible DNA-binding protein